MPGFDLAAEYMQWGHKVHSKFEKNLSITQVCNQLVIVSLLVFLICVSFVLFCLNMWLLHIIFSYFLNRDNMPLTSTACKSCQWDELHLSAPGSGSKCPICLSHCLCYVTHSGNTFMAAMGMKFSWFNLTGKTITIASENILILFQQQRCKYWAWNLVLCTTNSR